MKTRTVLLVLFCMSLPIVAQTRKPTRELPPSAFKLAAIKAVGSRRYSSDQVVAATGLEPGQTADDADFKRAAQILGETGAFTDVLYTFQTAPQGTKVEFQVADNDQLVSVIFDNLVWFSDQELLEKLRARVPLFQGQLPISGSLADQVSDALQSLLIENNIAGRVDYLRAAHQAGPIQAFVYSVTGATIHIRYAGFAGAGPDELPALGALAMKLQGADYVRSILRIQADKTFLPVYLERGYLTARFADPQPKVIKTSPEETVVDVSFRVEPGLQYKLSGIEWSGTAAFPPEKLQTLLHLQPGDFANSVQLGKDLDAIKRLYGTGGYMAATILPVPQMDDSHSTVSYQLQVHEGDVYKMGELEIQGLDSRTTARLVYEWKLRSGVAYDSSYPQQFQHDIRDLLPAGEWRVSLHESLEESDKTVDVTMRFDPKQS